MKCLLIILFFPVSLFAQLRLAKIFSDNMILQRNEPVHIWGTAPPGKEILVSFAKEKKATHADKNGKWDIFFKKQPATRQPQTISLVCNRQNVQLKNILIGDVWLCIGQSNMEFPLQQEMHCKEELPQADQPLVRLYNPVFIGKNLFGKPYSDSMIQRLNANDFYTGQWQYCDSNSAKTMSAIGYYFGKRIVASENIPVGLVHLAIGGCPLETFIDSKTLAADKRFAKKVNSNWLNNEAIAEWVRQRGRDNIGAQGQNHAFKPGFAYAAGVEPIIPAPIKGVLLYQGESNAQEPERVAEYAAMMKLMIKDYRAKWKQPHMPFYWIQLSSIDTTGYKSQLWPQFRDEQRKLLQDVSDGGMAVCSDFGFRNNVHPTNKKEPAERLARWALNQTYHRNIIPSGPLPLTANYEHGNIVVRFKYSKGLQTSDGKVLRGFSTDGVNDTGATIQADKIIITAAERPAFIYYAWKPFTEANLVNAENLPASTFKIKIQ